MPQIETRIAMNSLQNTYLNVLRTDLTWNSGGSRHSPGRGSVKIPGLRSPARALWAVLCALLFLLGLVYKKVDAVRPEPGFYYPDPGTPDNATMVKVCSDGARDCRGRPNSLLTQVGIYLMNIYEVLPGSNSFWATFYLFFKFSANETRWIESNFTYNPLDGFELNNGIQALDIYQKKITEKPELVPASNEMQVQLYFQGRLYQPLDLKNYPLDRQTLSINIENNAETRNLVRYVADDEQSNFDSLMKLPGWSISSLTSQVLIHHYNTNFGITGSDSEQTYSTLHFVVEIRRSPNLFGWKLLLPLLLVLISNWLALLLHPSFVEVRTGMCATALLTTVFLQQSSIDASIVSGLVIMDQLYILAYVLIVITFSLVILDNNRIRQYTADEKDVQTEERQLLEMGKENDLEARREMVEMLEERRQKEEAVVRNIRIWNYSCLALQIMTAIIVIVTVTVVEPNQV